MVDMIENNELITFENIELKLKVKVSHTDHTVWLTLFQMSKLFDEKNHIKRYDPRTKKDKIANIIVNSYNRNYIKVYNRFIFLYHF